MFKIPLSIGPEGMGAALLNSKALEIDLSQTTYSEFLAAGRFLSSLSALAKRQQISRLKP